MKYVGQGLGGCKRQRGIEIETPCVSILGYMACLIFSPVQCRYTVVLFLSCILSGDVYMTFTLHPLRTQWRGITTASLFLKTQLDNVLNRLKCMKLGRVSEIRFPHFKSLFLSFVNLARFHFLAPWRNEYSVACLTRKLQGLVNLYWTLGLWLQSRKYFLQLGYINASMSLGTITGFRLFFLSLFSFYETSVFLYCVTEGMAENLLLQFRWGGSHGWGCWMLGWHSTSKTCFLVLFCGEQPYPVLFFPEISSRSQLCNRLRLLSWW